MMKIRNCPVEFVGYMMEMVHVDERGFGKEKVIQFVTEYITETEINYGEEYWDGVEIDDLNADFGMFLSYGCS